ncbi:MAG: c-type cytochrome [Aeromonas sp.]
MPYRSVFTPTPSHPSGVRLLPHAVALLALSLTSGAVLANETDMSRAAIEARIAPAGEVYRTSDLAGIVVATASSDAATAAASARSGEAVYKASCFACHDTGAAGAPKRGDAAAWQPRLAQGQATLIQHALNGYQGKVGVMPARGACPSCSDEEIANAVGYLTQP